MRDDDDRLAAFVCAFRVCVCLLTVVSVPFHLGFDDVVLVVILEHVVVVGCLRWLGVRVRQRDVLAVLHSRVGD